jgi:hypothetical protein
MRCCLLLMRCCLLFLLLLARLFVNLLTHHRHRFDQYHCRCVIVTLDAACDATLKYSALL